MIYLRKFNESKQNIESIEAICKKYGITNYTINEDGSIDVNSSVFLSNRRLTKLPLKFRNVSGNFYCRDNQLTTLEGSPTAVGGDFACSSNQLTTLEGAPQSVGDNFNCNNNILKTLQGAPTAVGGNFACSSNQLTTLEGAPQSVGRSFFCSNNQLVNLEFAPSCQILYCNNNPIYKWWDLVDDTSKLYGFIDLGIDTRDPDFMNAEKINLLNE